MTDLHLLKAKNIVVAPSHHRHEQDALLVEAVTQFGKDWNRISAYVGEGANSDRCWQRWNRCMHTEQPPF